MKKFWIIPCSAAALIAADFAAAGALIRATMIRTPEMADDPKPDDTPAWQEYYRRAKAGKAWILGQPHENWEITSFDGLHLAAVFLPAEVPTNRTILCVHGYRANGCFDFGAAAPFLHGLGWNLLLPDDRAHGASEGTFLGFGNLDSVDCVSWCRELVKKTGSDCRIVLYGISMGAASVLAASGDPDLPSEVRAVAADCGFSSGWAEVKRELGQMFHLPAFPILPTADLLMRWKAGYSLRERAAIDRVRNSKLPLLIIHGTDDTFVPTSMGQEIYEASASPDKHLLLVKGAVHAHSYLTDTEAYEKAFRELIEKAEET